MLVDAECELIKVTELTAEGTIPPGGRAAPPTAQDRKQLDLDVHTDMQKTFSM